MLSVQKGGQFDCESFRGKRFDRFVRADLDAVENDVKVSLVQIGPEITHFVHKCLILKTPQCVHLLCPSTTLSPATGSSSSSIGDSIGLTPNCLILLM